MKKVITIYKSCSKCGKIHDSKYKCKTNYKFEARRYDETRKIRNNYKWHTKAKEIKAESYFLCAVCLEEGIYNYKDLEVHHIEKIRDNKNKLLDNDNLICLCKRHHILADNGTISKEHLFELVKKREDKKEN